MDDLLVVEVLEAQQHVTEALPDNSGHDDNFHPVGNTLEEYFQRAV